MQLENLCHTQYRIKVWLRQSYISDKWEANYIVLIDKSIVLLHDILLGNLILH